MTFKSFLKLVEIQTKVASFFPFLLGTVYAYFRFGTFKPMVFGLMLASLLLIDMTTTAINNYMDYKKAVKRHGFGYETHNAIVRDRLHEKYVVSIIIAMLILAVVFGLLLVWQTDLVVLLLGAVSFAAGILYSFGPIPISRTPYGEMFSGSFMGLLIPFIAAYIQAPSGSLIKLAATGSAINLTLNWPELLFLFLITLPTAVGIANIMLANNICDIDDDLANQRRTLPSFLGVKSSVWLFRVLYYIAYVSVAVLIVLRVITWPALIFMLTLIPVELQIRKFAAKQSKQETFVIAVKNFVLLAVSLIISIALAILLKAA
jgi:1,4-dihydroxy-2-naphthoate octaprenyltransferase